MKTPVTRWVGDCCELALYLWALRLWSFVSLRWLANLFFCVISLLVKHIDENWCSLSWEIKKQRAELQTKMGAIDKAASPYQAAQATGGKVGSLQSASRSGFVSKWCCPNKRVSLARDEGQTGGEGWLQGSLQNPLKLTSPANQPTNRCLLNITQIGHNGQLNIRKLVANIVRQHTPYFQLSWLEIGSTVTISHKTCQVDNPICGNWSQICFSFCGTGAW